MRRVIIPELLDSDAGTPEEIRKALVDLQNINRWFGGTRTTVSLLRSVAEKSGRQKLSVLDIGAGPGETAVVAAKRLSREGIEVRSTLLDRAHSHLPRNGVPTVAGDALALPFSNASFDVVSSSLFLHHMEPEQIVAAIDEALRVSRLAVVINDLQRSAAHLALVYAGLPLFRSRLTWHDAPASVRRAYTTAELRELLRRTRADDVSMSRHYLYRVGVIAWKNSAHD
jgi:ubiquinone/menaquinone biosynthesis C-methylase UbiE